MYKDEYLKYLSQEARIYKLNYYRWENIHGNQYLENIYITNLGFLITMFELMKSFSACFVFVYAFEFTEEMLNFEVETSLILE